MITVRVAAASDREVLGRFGAALVRQHERADARRFIHVENPEAGYGRYLVSQLPEPDTRVLVAEHEGRVVGYLLADVEDMNWMALRGPCGVIHDVYVEEGARRLGAGRELLRAAIDWIRSKGRRQVVLMTESHNERAQGLFAALGFRTTMFEMTLDLDGGDSGGEG